jgi:hypothetical protein
MNLIFDVVLHIARFDEDAWYKLYCVDERFREYVQSYKGKHEFIRLFAERKNIATVSSIRLFGLFHSIYDEPGFVCFGGSKSWYYRGRLHRDNDLPAIITHYGRMAWYQHGELHRDSSVALTGQASAGKDNGLPAVMRPDGSQEWWIRGVRIK